jgi:hypothetical protein
VAMVEPALQDTSILSTPDVMYICPPPHSLVNIGQTCWLNSIVQGLFATAGVAAHATKAIQRDCKCGPCALSAVFRGMQEYSSMKVLLEDLHLHFREGGCFAFQVCVVIGGPILCPPDQTFFTWVLQEAGTFQQCDALEGLGRLLSGVLASMCDHPWVSDLVVTYERSTVVRECGHHSCRCVCCSCWTLVRDLTLMLSPCHPASTGVQFYPSDGAEAPAVHRTWQPMQHPAGVLGVPHGCSAGG